MPCCRRLQATLWAGATSRARFGTAKNFTVRAASVARLLSVSAVLSGREAELRVLLDALDKLARGAVGGGGGGASGASSETSMVLLHGPGGSGKSRLLSELRTAAVASKCLFVSGKFDQFNRRPLSAWAHAIAGMVRTLVVSLLHVVSSCCRWTPSRWRTPRKCSSFARGCFSPMPWATARPCCLMSFHRWRSSPAHSHPPSLW